MAATIENDAHLVSLLSQDNILAFNDLFYRYSGKLYRFAYGFLKSEVEAEDIVQEVFLIVWLKRKQLRNELSFKSYLFTITSNLIKKNFRRKVYLKRYLNYMLKDDYDPHTVNSIDYAFAKDYLDKLVDQLPAKRKEIFKKSRFLEMSIKDIASDMGISHKTVENQLTSALRSLRNVINL